jgi:HipA-like C-terminal domain
VPEEVPFPVIDVTEWEITNLETSGAEAKFWLEEPGTDQRWLFKSVTIKDGHVHGEDWAEKAASHLANLMGVPCARVELAVRGESLGSISANLRPASHQMQPGQVLLETCHAPRYVHHSRGNQHPGHSLENIQDALRGAMPPPGCELPFDASAFDVFAGYVLFDAWIANQDRHDNNWSVLIPITALSGPVLLSGSYDHASSLAFNEQDTRRETLLSRSDGVASWCARGRANKFEGRPRLTEAAMTALYLASPEAREYWTGRLRRVSDGDVRRMLSRVPRMSDPARMFAAKLLEVNRMGVLHAYS